MQADLEATVAAEVADGDCVWLGNFGTQLFAVGRCLIEQGRRNLHVVIGSGGILLDQLLAAGVVSEVTFAHCWSPVGPYPTRAFRAAWEQPGKVVFHELSLAALSTALDAGAAGVPCGLIALPADSAYRAWSPSLLAAIDTPFGAALAVRAIRPDVSFVHAVLADRWGNAALGTPAGEAPAAMAAARRSVVVAEQLTSTEAVSARGVTIPGVCVDVICTAAGSARPDGVPGLYARDVDAYEEYAGR